MTRHERCELQRQAFQIEYALMMENVKGPNLTDEMFRALQLVRELQEAIGDIPTEDKPPFSLMQWTKPIPEPQEPQEAEEVCGGETCPNCQGPFGCYCKVKTT